MANHYPEMTQVFDALGLPAIMPEPEVLKAGVARVQTKALASVVANLIAEHEPLLYALADGTTVTVRERGGPGQFKITVEAL
jgi:hypothetical protein